MSGKRNNEIRKWVAVIVSFLAVLCTITYRLTNNVNKENQRDAPITNSNTGNSVTVNLPAPAVDTTKKTGHSGNANYGSINAENVHIGDNK